jgi:hypothetical protein
VTVEALAGQVGVARAFIAGRPCLAAAVLASELVTGSVLHGGSAVSGGQVAWPSRQTGSGCGSRWPGAVAPLSRCWCRIPALRRWG